MYEALGFAREGEAAHGRRPLAVEEACLPERVCLEFAQDVAMLLMCMADEDGHWTE